MQGENLVKKLCQVKKFPNFPKLHKSISFNKERVADDKISKELV